MDVGSEFPKPQLEAHLQQWFAERMPSVSGNQATRLESLHLAPIARVTGLTESELRRFALGKASLSLRSLASLIIVVKCLGYKPLLGREFES